MQADLARVNRVPSDWGLEIGVLAEVYRNCSTRRICQVDIAENYEHKHQRLSPGEPGKGLMKMAMDISKSLLSNLAAEGVKFDSGMMQTLLVRYLRMAENNISKYHADAMINGLLFDRHKEEIAVETFCQALKLATDENSLRIRWGRRQFRTGCESVLRFRVFLTICEKRWIRTTRHSPSCKTALGSGVREHGEFGSSVLTLVKKKRLFVFTDLDGTLLDPSDYEWGPAIGLLAELRKKSIPVVFCTEQTEPRSKISNGGWDTRTLTSQKNGGILVLPMAFLGRLVPRGDRPRELVLHLGWKHADILQVLRELAQRTKVSIRCFHQMTRKRSPALPV